MASCDSCKGEKGKLEAEEKVLMEKLQQQMKPEAWNRLETSIRNIKRLTRQQLEVVIKTNKILLEDIDKIGNGDYQHVAPNTIIGFIMTASVLQEASIDASYASNLIESINNDTKKLQGEKQILQFLQQKAQQLLQDPKIQQLLQDKNVFIKAKENLSDYIKLLENFKKQAK